MEKREEESETEYSYGEEGWHELSPGCTVIRKEAGSPEIRTSAWDKMR
jgi:hypothetical protein